jgi:hypothetical protein
MKGQKGWDYKPYSRLNEMYKRENPYVCRLAPFKDGCLVAWIDQGKPKAAHSIRYQQRATEYPPVTVKAEGSEYTITGLKPDCEYEVTVFRTDEPDAKSDTRLFRSGFYPGQIVSYIHPKDKAYSFSGMCPSSPSIVRTDSGRILASTDVWYNVTMSRLTLIYKSDDEGKTWQYLCELFPCQWGELFCHKGKVYMLATTTEWGCLLIGCSEDDGETWSSPVFMFPGSGSNAEGGPHKGANPVFHYKGRIWSALEYGAWNKGYIDSGVISVSEDADLMNPENWACTGFLRFDTTWKNASPGGVRVGARVYIEGNIISAPDGALYNMLRDCNHVPSEGSLGKAVFLKIDPDNPEKMPEFHSIIDFNGGTHKFVVDRDEKTGVYYTVVNRAVSAAGYDQRNVLSFSVSKDLFHWKIVKDLLDYQNEAPEETGLQYTYQLRIGDDLYFLCRTAFNHASTFHDANCITFHKVENFKDLLSKA